MKVTIIIERPKSITSHPQKITLEGCEDYLPEAVEFLELALKCMGFIYDGKLQIVEDEE